MVKYIYSIGPRGPKLESMSLVTNDEIRWISFGKIYFRFRELKTHSEGLHKMRWDR